MCIHLSPRLAAIAALVPAGARVIDVGTDHAMLPVWLAQTKAAAHVWASDIRPGPLQSARRLVEETAVHDRVALRLTDGLDGFSRADGDTVVIAGMGGETMVHILSGAPWVKEGVLLILAPQTKQDVLRGSLIENGFCIRREMLVRDGGRIYPIMTVTAGRAPAYTEAELHTGLFSLISGDALFPEYLSRLMERASSAAPYDAGAAVLLAQYEKMEELLKCRP